MYQLGNRRVVLTTLLGATAMTAPFAITPAFAQDAQAASDSNVIIVTAQRRSEALEEVPMTVSVVTNETLEAAGVTSLRDIANVTSGYQLGQGGAFPQPAVRGITTIINGTSFENNVAVYVDGFYEVAPQALNIDLPNVESVQVLKGPQGTLYGRNATGGAILLNTITPGDAWEGKAELTYARFDDKRASGYVAGPLNDWLGISVAGYIRRSDGYVKLTSRTTPGELDGNAAPLKQDSVRVKLRADLSDNFRAILGYNYTRTSDARGNMFSVFENVSPFFLLPGGATRPTRLGTAAWDIGAEISTKAHQGTLKLELDTGIGTLTSYTGYTTFKPVTSFDFDGSYINSRWSTSEFRQKTFQQALDYSINAIDNLDLIVGATYFKDKLRTTGPNIANFINPAGAAPTDPGLTPPTLDSLVQSEDRRFSQNKEAWAVYADATFHVTDRFAINVGGRYSKETQDVFGSSICLVGCTATNSQVIDGVPYFFPPTGRSSTYKKFTPRASIRYEIAPRTNIYASYSKGFRSGAWNASLPLLPAGPAAWNDAEQESINAYEIGLKTAGDFYRFELSGFYYDYKNLQVSYTTVIDGNTATIIDNAPSAEVYGVEGSFEIKPFENFTVRGSATWLHARYGDDFIFDNQTGVDPTRVGINQNSNPLKTFLNISQTQDLSGLQMARAPNFTASLGMDYLIPNGDGGLRFAVNGKYTDSYVVTNPAIWGPALIGTEFEEFARKQRFRQGRYALLNASVTWTDPGDNFYIRVWGNNLTDHKYRLHYTGTGIGTYAPMAEPLTYGVTVGFKFNQDAAPPPPAPPPPPPAPPPPPPPAQVVCNKGPYIVFFDWDKSDVTPEAATILDSAIGAYANCESVPIMLAGYTDRSGSTQYNMGLSERRNASVRSYLTARGIPDGAITSQAFGESNPRVPTADGVRELQNRRVEITYGPGSGM